MLAYLTDNHVRFVIENHIPIILVSKEEYQEKKEYWQQQMKDMKYKKSWGIRINYEEKITKNQ